MRVDGDIRSAGPLFSDPTVHPDRLLTLDRHIRRQAMARSAQAGQQQPSLGGFLSINIAPIWLTRLQGHDASPTLQLIEALSIDPSRVVIEVTETGADLTVLKQVIRAYRDRGIGIAIDDFGAGEAHLDRVIDLEPDLVKLDMKLFKRAYRGEGLAREVVEALSRLAERTGFQLVIEGVETESELAYAMETGARLVQGFLLARPEPDFLDTHALSPHIERVRRQVFHHQVDIHRRQGRLAQRIQSVAGQLRDLIEHRSDTALVGLGVPCDAILRCFVTNTEGQQLSPNYDAHQGKLQPQPLVEPRNWSWRPYFAEIVAGFDFNPDTLGHSRPYMDVNSSRLVQTYGLPLSNNRILLIDVVSSDTADAQDARARFA
ncbi:signal transduction protein [Saccharospirillum salsuginis]|uniref:Signal transduction protein n=2 Tax=Saccharospirillum salsuginis TaxID=418750 RepID=A0A918NH69_9GAMM|nr:signal transduction protein [Saccharospirillum salsuginis]